MSNRIRVTVCDHSAVIRHGLMRMLSSDPSIEIVFQATSQSEMLVNYDSIKTDIILVDFEEKGQSRLGFLRELKALLPEAKIIALNQCSNQNRIIEVLELGVRGFQCKQDASAEEIINAIHTVHRGGTDLTPQILATLLGNMPSTRFH